MSGTYELDGALFPVNPLAKRWAREQVETSGVGEGIYSAFWRLELDFPILDVDQEASFFYDRWMAGGLHTAVLPHPRTGQLVSFTGVNIVDWLYEFNDVDADEWGIGGRMVLGHISLSATGTV